MCTCRFRWINCIQFDIKNLSAFARQVSGLKKSPIACARKSRHGAVTHVVVSSFHLPIPSVVPGFWCDVIDLYIQTIFKKTMVCYVRAKNTKKMDVLRMVRFGFLCRSKCLKFLVEAFSPSGQCHGLSIAAESRSLLTMTLLVLTNAQYWSLTYLELKKLQIQLRMHSTLYLFSLFSLCSGLCFDGPSLLVLWMVYKTTW